MLSVAPPASTGVPPVGLGPLGVVPAYLESRAWQHAVHDPEADVPTLSILLDAHDEQVRGTIATRLPTGWVPEWDGPLLRVTTPMRGFGFARDLEALSVDDLDALIGRTRDFFAQRGESVEWKTYGHDRADLTERLSLAGFEPEGDETVVIGRAADLAAPSGVIDGVSIRATTDPADLRRIAKMESEVWGRIGHGWLTTWRTASRPRPTTSTSSWQKLKEESSPLAGWWVCPAPSSTPCGVARPWPLGVVGASTAPSWPDALRSLSSGA